MINVENIVIVSQNYYPAQGGITTFTYQLAKYLSKNYKLTLITREYTDLDEISVLEDFDVIRLNDKNWKQEKNKLILKEIKKFYPKKTLFIGTNWKMSLPMMIWSLTKKIKYITAVHGLDVHEGRRLNRALQLATFKRSSLLTFASSYTQSFLSDIIKKEKMMVLCNGYDDTNFYIEEDLENIILKYELKSQNYIFCFGRLVERKGFDNTIKAFKLLDNVDLIIAGTGQYENELKKIAIEEGLTERVHFIGKVSDDELRKLYSSALVYCMPSRTVNKNDFEGFGITYIEAAACGTCSIGGKESGAIDAIIDGETGYLVDPLSFEEIADKLKLLINNTDLRNELSYNAKKRAEKDFTWEKITNDLFLKIKEKVSN